MADIGTVVTKLLDLADSVNDYLPAAPLSQGIIDLARHVDQMIDHFGDEIPVDQQEAAQVARRKLAERVAEKSRDLSAKLRG